MQCTQGTFLHVAGEHSLARNNRPLSHVSLLAKAEFKIVPHMVQPPTSRRAARPAAARARAVYVEAASSPAQDVQRSPGTCHLHSLSSTLVSMVLAFLFQFGVESRLCCASVHRSSVPLARVPSNCLPRKSAPSNPSIERTRSGSAGLAFISF